MALSTRHRSAIFEGLKKVMGEEEADAMLAEFPASEHDELVTKAFLRAELADVRTEIADVRTELADVRTEIAHAANRTLVATSAMLVAGMGVAAAVGSALGS